MAQQLINLGNPDQNDGDPGRVGGQKINANFTELYATRAQYKYTAVAQASYGITDTELVLGTNIFGVNYSSPVAITLPQGIDSNKIVVIKDESGLASTNNITLTIV